MKVVLQERVAKLGNGGEIVIVKDGYARNFLIPQGLAKFADKNAIAEAETLQAKAKDAEKGRKEDMKKQLKAIDGKSVTIKMKADENGKLFGSVSANDVLKKVNEIGGSFDQSEIKWEPRKELGTYDVKITPDKDQTATVTVNIEKE